MLLWEDAQTAGENTPLLLRESLGAFRDAIRDDTGNADAKYNLELLSTLVQPSSQRRLDAPQEGGAGGVRGAGLGRGGRGY